MMKKRSGSTAFIIYRHIYNILFFFFVILCVHIIATTIIPYIYKVFQKRNTPNKNVIPYIEIWYTISYIWDIIVHHKYSYYENITFT